MVLKKRVAGVTRRQELKLMTHLKSVTLLVVALGLFALPSRADTTYIYAGNSFNEFGSATCPPECKITGSFTVSTPLGPNFNGYFTPKSFSFTDGVVSFTQVSATNFAIGIVTDNLGNITVWNLFFQNAQVTMYVSTGPSVICPVGCSAVDGSFSTAFFARILNDPGTWSSVTATNVLWYTGGTETGGFRFATYEALVANLTNQAAAHGPAWNVTIWTGGENPMPAGPFNVLVVASTAIGPWGGAGDPLAGNNAALNAAISGGSITLDPRVNRILLTGQDADFHYNYGVPSSDTFDGPQGFLTDAINWAAGGTGMGAVIIDPGDCGFNGVCLPASMGNTGVEPVGAHQTDHVLIPASEVGFPINTGLSSAGLSNWGESDHQAFSSFDTTLWTGINQNGDFPGEFATIVSAPFVSAGMPVTLTFTPGPLQSQVAVFGGSPSGPGAHSIKFTESQTLMTHKITVTPFYVPINPPGIGSGDGSCETGADETTDFDCRFTQFFLGPVVPGGNLVPQIYPYSNSQGVFYRVTDAPEFGSGFYSGDIYLYIAWNQTLLPTGPFASDYQTTPHLYDDPSDDTVQGGYPVIPGFPYSPENHQFVFDITTYFNPGGGQVGDPGLGAKIRQYNDFAVAFPLTNSALGLPSYTYTWLKPKHNRIFDQTTANDHADDNMNDDSNDDDDNKDNDVLRLRFTLTPDTPAGIAVTSPHHVGVAVLSGDCTAPPTAAAIQAIQVPAGSPTTVTYNRKRGVYAFKMLTTFPPGQYNVRTSSDLFPDQCADFRIKH
jgi:hypothetical protein